MRSYLRVYQRFKNTLFSQCGVRKRLRSNYSSNYVVYEKKKLSIVVRLLGNNICMTKNENDSKAAFSFPQMRN